MNSLALTEVGRNLRTSPLRTIVLMLVFLAVGAGVSAFTISDVERIADVAEAQYRAGAFVYEVVGPSGERVDALRCNALNGEAGVSAAGGVMARTAVSLASQPDAELRLLTVTPHFIAAAWPGDHATTSPSTFAGSALMDLGVRDEASVRYRVRDGDQQLIDIDAIASTRAVTGAEAVLVEVAPPSGTVDSCLVLVKPSVDGEAYDALAGLFGPGTTVRELLPPSGLVADPEALFDGRLSAYAWLAASIVCAIALFGSWLGRRQEYALYRLIGFSEGAVFAMLCTEAALVCVLPAQLGLILGMGTQPLELLTSAALALDVARFDAAILVLPAVGYLLLPRRSLLPSLLGK